MNEPRWRTVMCWSAVVTFFTMPLVVFILHIVAIERGWNTSQRWGEMIIGLGELYKIVAALVFGLAGLNSWDRRIPSPPPSETKDIRTTTAVQMRSKRSDTS